MKNHEIYRAIKAGADSKKIYKPYTTMRAPGNVPYVVDNLWEWKRPDEYPNRRYSAFASPTAELAMKSARRGERAYKVELKGEPKVCQLMGWEDSKCHPECTNLRGIILNRVGKDWPDYNIDKKVEIGRLFMPCLKKEEVEGLFNRVEALKKINKEISDAIRYWNHVVLIKEGDSLPDPQGEVFFEYEDGFELVDI